MTSLPKKWQQNWTSMPFLCWGWVRGCREFLQLQIFPASEILLVCKHLRMYCIDTEALVFMFNEGSSYGFTIHPIFTRICMLYEVFNGLDGLKGPLLVYIIHINNEKHMHHGFLASQVYLCSTSLMTLRCFCLCRISKWCSHLHSIER